MREQLKTLIQQYLKNKFDTEEATKYLVNFDEYCLEFEKCIDLYNQLKQRGFKPYLINCINLNKIYKEELPSYKFIISQMLENENLQKKVFTELANSNYFKEVYEIKNQEHLLINVLILLYRTTMLNLYSGTREAGAQYSSCLEELAAEINLEYDKDLRIHQATKHWIKNWEEELFDERLYRLIFKK